MIGMLVMFSCPVQERILSRANTMVSKDTISFHLRKVIPTALHSCKQGGWGGRAFGVAHELRNEVVKSSGGVKK